MRILLERIRSDLYGDWQNADSKGIREQVRELSRSLEKVSTEREQDHKEIDALRNWKEEREHLDEVALARREGQAQMFKLAKTAGMFLTSGTALYLLGQLWRFMMNQ